METGMQWKLEVDMRRDLHRKMQSPNHEITSLKSARISSQF